MSSMAEVIIDIHTGLQSSDRQYLISLPDGMGARMLSTALHQTQDYALPPPSPELGLRAR